MCRSGTLTPRRDGRGAAMEGIFRVMERIREIEARIAGLSCGLIPQDVEAAGPGRAGTASFSILLEEALSSRGEEVVREASRYLGVPYVWGGESPSGFDCSGLVRFVFRKFGVDLPHYTESQARLGTPVARQDLRPGDVIFFGEDGGRGFLYHVGIYVGNNCFIHAPHRGDVVKVSELSGKYARNYACARRYL